MNSFGDSTSPARFANGELLKQYIGKRIRTVIKVIDKDPNVIVGQTADGCRVKIKTLRNNIAYHTAYAEVIGVVEEEFVIREEYSTDFGDKFDMSSFNELCKLANNEGLEIF